MTENNDTTKLPRIEDPRGNLSFIEHGSSGACPFEIESVGWVYDVPAGAVRKDELSGGSRQMIVAMSGSFDVTSDNRAGSSVHLNRSDRAVVTEAGECTTLCNFSTNSVAMILADRSQISAERKENSEDIKSSHITSNVANARIIALPRRRSESGSVTVAENGADWLPFDIRRVFYLFDVPADAERGGHSHFQARELIVALSGSFDVVLDDGKHEPRRFTLNRPYTALYVPTGLWRTLDSFSGGSVCMVLTSERYSEEDYVREYDRFKKLTSEKGD